MFKSVKTCFKDFILIIVFNIELKMNTNKNYSTLKFNLK